MSSPQPMPYFALIYYVDEHYVQRRTALREQHLAVAAAARARGELVMGGALGDPIERALLVFRGEDRTVAERFAHEDPYVKNGLVTRWEVQPWYVVVGGETA